MSPAPLAADAQPDRQLKTLARAFEALLLTTQHISSKEQLLQQRLKDAHDEYLKLANRLPGGLDPHTKIVSEKILGRRPEFESEYPPKQNLNTLDVVKDLAESGNVGDSSLDAISEGVRIYKSFLNPEDDDGSTGVVATRAGSLERDFTTRGTRGSLRCPFSKSRLSSENGVNGIETTGPTQNSDTCGIQHLDPIKEEQLDRRSSLAPSVRSSNRCPASRCPIRFLDQHSPEEIADYVERHKHEIPRSHAICVKRYSNSSRQMDAKYGDLTNMIRGLSEKHQAFLPGQHARTASSSAGRVEKWAEEIKLEAPAEGEEAILDDDNRDGHFDRPMREVRVGESPSRPWGIHVPIPSPLGLDTPAESPLDPGLTTSKPVENTATDAPKIAPKVATAGRCPFGHGGGAPPPDHPAIEPEPAEIKGPVQTERPPEGPKPNFTKAKEEEAQTDQPPKAPAANIVFNGPVFFGFSPEQTAAVMQQLASLGINKS
ncbi:hypothetical protein BJY04DRAFT_201886 [Aspergillus karnatakaensis]|uniref:uncharacterized protein n=1 Tax=Aspergillus karnatakaensis TaxID=1810916 RepID=UPI003CCE5188